MVEKGRQFHDFQGEVNPNTYMTERCLVRAAITLPNIGMHFVSDSEKQQLYCPPFVVLHYLLPLIPCPAASALLLQMPGFPFCSLGLSVHELGLSSDGAS